MEVNITGQYKVIYFQRINSTIIASLKITLTSVSFPVKDRTHFLKQLDQIQVGYPAGIRKLPALSVPSSTYFL